MKWIRFPWFGKLPWLGRKKEAERTAIREERASERESTRRLIDDMRATDRRRMRVLRSLEAEIEFSRRMRNHGQG